MNLKKVELNIPDLSHLDVVGRPFRTFIVSVPEKRSLLYRVTARTKKEAWANFERGLYDDVKVEIAPHGPKCIEELK